MVCTKRCQIGCTDRIVESLDAEDHDHRGLLVQLSHIRHQRVAGSESELSAEAGKKKKDLTFG